MKTESELEHKRLPFDDWKLKAKACARERMNLSADDDVSFLLGDDKDMRAAYDDDEAWSFHAEDYVEEQIESALS